MTIKIVLFCVLSHQLIAQNNCERKNSESVLNGLEPLGVKPLKIRSKYTLKFSYYFLGRRIFSWMRTKYCQNPCFVGTAQITSSASLLSWNHGNVLNSQNDYRKYWTERRKTCSLIIYEAVFNIIYCVYRFDFICALAENVYHTNNTY